MSPLDNRPQTCGMALKEWAGICQALVSGQQAILLRKGGISEAPTGFRPEHPWFWLFPTHLHESEQLLRPPLVPLPDPTSSSRPGDLSITDPNRVPLQALAHAGSVWWVDQLDSLKRLADLHFWTDETVEKRFHYRKPGLWVMGVRVFIRSQPVWFDVTRDQHGCKSWVPLESPLETGDLSPVVGDQEFGQRMALVEARLSGDR